MPLVPPVRIAWVVPTALIALIALVVLVALVVPVVLVRWLCAVPGLRAG